MYKVFIENRAVEFVNSQKIEPNFKGIEATAITNIQEDLRDVLVNSHSSECLVVFCDDTTAEWERLFQHHQFIHAAGGVVRKNIDWLVIKRLGKLDLPKGHLDGDELPECAAEREIMEECGVSSIKLTKYITTTFHTYEYEGRQVLKRTDWFLFDYFGDGACHPQVEEGIEAVFWMSPTEIRKQLPTFFASIQFVIDETTNLISYLPFVKNG